MTTSNFRPNNSISSINSYNNRVSYDVLIKFNISKDKYFDFFKEDQGYGKRDSAGVVSFPDESRMSTIPGPRQVMALEFVVRAWSDCKAYIESYVTSKKIKPSPFLENLVPVIGYESPHAAHYDRSLLLYNSLIGNMKDCMYSYSSFIESIIGVLEREDIPLTKTAYLTSNVNTIRSTGLSLEFMRENFSNDAKKDIMFFQDRNFQFYLRALKKHGFRIDINAPWRIVFDIYSSQGKRYIEGNYMLNAYKYDMQYLSVILPYFFRNWRDSKKLPSKSIPPLEESDLLVYYSRIRAAESKIGTRRTNNLVSSLNFLPNPILSIDKECNVKPN